MLSNLGKKPSSKSERRALDLSELCQDDDAHKTNKQPNSSEQQP
jgi:hypothetical protein